VISFAALPLCHRSRREPTAPRDSRCSSAAEHISGRCRTSASDGRPRACVCNGGRARPRRGRRLEELAAGARHGLLGRPRHPPPPHSAPPLRAISEEAAAALLVDARTRLGRDATTQSRRGRVEHEVVAAADGMDLLVLARDGDHARLGPHSLGPHARFVVDHAPCRVLMIWPDTPPPLTTIPPPPP
jgi:nucleotide-binding universal stress UspA family protein